MIVVMAKVSVIPEKKQELLELAKPVIETTRKELALHGGNGVFKGGIFARNKVFGLHRASCQIS